jgi:hypothetical protein
MLLLRAGLSLVRSSLPLSSIRGNQKVGRHDEAGIATALSHVDVLLCSPLDISAGLEGALPRLRCFGDR